MGTLDRKKIQKPDFGRPHLLILGAGASLAAFPNGDKHGRKLPLMNNIVEVVGLGPLLDAANIHEHRDDFEKLYSTLATSGKYPDLLAKVERAVFDYFAEMELPDEPTLYDHLVLSLRDKDVIATFNWDPFLVQAMVRNGHVKSLPKTLFMHGNVAIGHCMAHKPIGVGPRGRNCHFCGNALESCRLLFPVAQKDYTNDPFIAKTWELLQQTMKAAYVVTVFGYSAPVTDVEAVALLKQGWGESAERELEEIEIIDIKDDETLYRTWEPFIHTHHYRTSISFYESSIGSAPRRSCEAMWMELMEAVWIDTNPIPQDVGWDELMNWYEVLLEDEESTGRS